MPRFFGDTWYRGGRLAVKFIAPVFLPKRLTARGVVKERTYDENKMVLSLDVWLEDDKGQKSQVGEASCLSES